MIPILRPIVLLVLVGSLAAAVGEHYEQVTLTDGRVFTGWYNEITEVIRVPGKVAMSMPVPAAKIASRKRVDEPASAAAPKGADGIALTDSLTPAAKTPEEKAARAEAVAAAAQAAKATQLDAVAREADRKAKGALSDVERHAAQAERNAKKFVLRAREEDGKILTLEEVLSQAFSTTTNGKNTAALEMMDASRKALALYDAERARAHRNRCEAAQLRYESMPLPAADTGRSHRFPTWHPLHIPFQPDQAGR